MLLLASSVKLVSEIALMAFIGQWLLGLLAGRHRDSNLFYRLLATLTAPFVKAARWLAPPVVLDRHLPLVAFLILLLLWLAATATKINLCLQIGVEQCR